MIKIIKKGTRQKIECEECGCYFSFDEEDIEKAPSALSLLSSKAKTIVCPQCENAIYLDAEVKQCENTTFK